MKIHSLRFLGCLALSSAILCSAVPAEAQQTKILTAEKHNEYGLVYSLPVTALQVSVTGRRTVRKAGPFRQYAKRYLGTANVVSEDAVEWTITGVKVQTIGVRDNEIQYLMQLKAGAITFIGVSEDGMLLSINARPEEPDTEFDGSRQLTGNVVKAGGGVDDYLQFVDMDYVSAQNSMKQAEMVATSLMDVRDAYLSLTRGTADNMPSDGRQLELMLASLRQQEEALTRAFAGSETIEEFSSVYTYIPEDEGEEVLFRISDFDGFVDADDYSGSPVYIKTEIIVEGALPLDVNGEPKKFPKDGVVYAIPGTARISIASGSDNLFSKELEFSQFGTQFALAPSLFTDKKSPSFARFSPVTGALEEIGKVTESADNE